MSIDQTSAPAKASEEKETAEAPKTEQTKPDAKRKQPKGSNKPQKSGSNIVAKTDANAKEVEKEKAKEEKKAEKEEEKDEEKVVEEKALTINLRHAYLTYGRKAAPKAVRLVKKVSGKVFNTTDVKVDNSLNQALWSKGKTKTERKVSVKVQKLESGTVRVRPSEA